MKMGWEGCITRSTEETIDLGKKFSNYIEIGDVYGLIGDLASGKTTFIKGVLEGMDFKSPVTSPTFTLVNEYEAKIPVIHIDCYRESNLERWIELGMNDYMNEQNIVIVEWSDKLKSILPINTIEIEFCHKSINKREINLKK